MDNKLLTLIFFGQLTLLDDVWQLITFKMTTYDLNIWLEQKHEKQIRHMTWTKNTTNGQHMTSIHVCTRGISCGKKMVATMLRNKMCMQPMNIHSPKNVHIFSLGGWREFLYSCLPMTFPICSRSIHNGVPQILWVPNLFPKGIPNSTSLYPTSFTQSSPFLTFISEPKGRHSIFTLNLLFWGTSCFNYLFIFGWLANQNAPLKKKKKHLRGNPFNE
jgi:hypothetical protein